MRLAVSFFALGMCALSLTLACESPPTTTLATTTATTATPAKTPASATTLTPAQTAALARAKAATQALQGELKTALMGAITTGGPAAAVDVCAGVAPALAAKHSVDGVVVGRVGVRTRNANNTMPAWLKAPMATWKPVASVDEAPASTEAVLDDGTVVFASALYTAPLCEKCHGGAIADDVKAAIAARYPGDQATGFGPLSLRGAVWASVMPAAN